jgi:hypothetical protein
MVRGTGSGVSSAARLRGQSRQRRPTKRKEHPQGRARGRAVNLNTISRERYGEKQWL